MGDFTRTEDLLGDIRRLWRQLRPRRVVYVQPADAGRIRTLLDETGLSDVVSVVESTVIKDGYAVVADLDAIEETRERMRS